MEKTKYTKISNVKWDEFHTTVSESFKEFKQEKAFFDVTLVSEDQKQIQTHKIVLSTCSNFFKSILENNTQSHPLIYLSGVDSTNLQFLTDYIYEGEVRLFHEQLESFIETAKELEIAGLLKDEIFNDYFADQFIKKEKDDEELEKVEKKQKIKKSAVKSPRQSIEHEIVVDVSSYDQNEVKQKIKDLMMKKDDNFQCTVCGKMAKEYSNLRRHVEVHIEGLSYECHLCNNTFNKMHTLAKHKSLNHKGQGGYFRAIGKGASIKDISNTMEQQGKRVISAGIEQEQPKSTPEFVETRSLFWSS